MSEPVTRHAPRTSCAYDNLAIRMRELFYDLTPGPRYILSAPDALVGYESSVFRDDSAPATMFKGIPIVADDTVPKGEMLFMRNGAVLGRIVGIS